MRTILIIGIGTGNPAHMTLEGIAALQLADRVFIPTKGAEKDQLAAIRRDICAQHAPHTDLVEYALPVRDAQNPDYQRGVEDWHDAIARHYIGLISALGETETGAFLVWGDPGLYDSTLRILDRVRKDIAFDIKVIPGITAIAALTAAFAIPLNTLGNPVTITTGRQLAQGWPEGADTVVVLLDGKQTFASLDPTGLHIYWAAYVGMKEQILIHGPLAEVADQIVTTRTAARVEHGWIMDIYLLRRNNSHITA